MNKNTRYLQLKGETYCGSQFKRFQSMVGLIQGQKHHGKGHSGVKLLSSLKAESRQQGKAREERDQGPDRVPTFAPPWLTQTYQEGCLASLLGGSQGSQVDKTNSQAIQVPYSLNSWVAGPDDHLRVLAYGNINPACAVFVSAFPGHHRHWPGNLDVSRHWPGLTYNQLYSTMAVDSSCCGEGSVLIPAEDVLIELWHISLFLYRQQ